MLRAVFVNAFADNDEGVVDRPRDCEQAKSTARHIAKRVQVVHPAFYMEKCVDRAVRNARETDDLTWCVRAQRAALISAERSEISDSLIGSGEGVVGSCAWHIRRTGNVREIGRRGCASGTSERAEVLHFAILKNERVSRAIGGLCVTDNVAGRVDRVCRARDAAERSEVCDSVRKLCLSGADDGREQRESATEKRA